MKKQIVVVLCGFLTILFACNNKEDITPKAKEEADLNNDMDETSLTGNGWVKTFSEDFNNDFNQWNIWQGGAYNNEYQYYSNSSSNIRLGDGVLTIEAKKENVTGATLPTNPANKNFAFTSARIESKNFYTSNATTPKVRFSARIKLPLGYGMWPAFWSYGNNWPTNGEIDVLEARGQIPTQYATNYFYGTSPGVNLVTNSEVKINSETSLVDYWHVYEVIWEQNKLTFMFDGKVVDEKTGGYVPSLYGKLQRLTLNLAIGGDYFGNPDPSTIEPGIMYVDWVKVFTSN